MTPTENPNAGGIAITAILLLAALMWGLIWSTIEGHTKKKVAGLCAHLLIGATAFLWVPWVGLGLTMLNRANLAKVNDLGRPEIVTPPADKVRPSAAEVPK